MSLQRCQDETTSTQFIDWMTYLEQDINAFHREDHFWANIAAEVRRSWVNSPEKVKIKTFLLKFKRKRESKRAMTRKEAAERSKRKWFAWLRGKGKM